MAVDKQNMLKTLEEFPKQCREAMELPRGRGASKDIDNVVVLGMGGSAISGDVLKSYLKDCPIPIHVVRDYTLPSFVTKKSLVFAISYSGQTEETISATEQAIERKAYVVGISSGGKIAGMCDKHVRIPEGFQPRCALAYLFFPLLGTLYNTDPSHFDVKNEELNEMLTILSRVEEFKERAKKLANTIKNRTPVMYSSELLRPAAMRWKTQINENAKTPAFFHTFAEMNHNEIVGYEHMGRDDFVAIMIRDKQDHPQIQKRMDITSEIMEKRVDVEEVYTKGSSLLSRLFSTMYLGDFTSYYLAMYKRVDPTPVDVIQGLKEKIK